MTKRKKKFTVPEFKTWLDGIMQFQDKEWSPTREQWEEIYEQIMNLKEPVNKEKMSLTDTALDEINGIVYDNMREMMANMPRPHMAPPPQHPQPQPQDADGQPAPQMIPPSGDGNALANKSLSELRREAEEKHNAVGGEKLPDVMDGSIPNDYV